MHFTKMPCPWLLPCLLILIGVMIKSLKDFSGKNPPIKKLLVLYLADVDRHVDTGKAQCPRLP